MSAVEEEKNKEILSLLRPQKAGTFDPYFRHSFLHFKRIEDRGEDRRVLLTKCFLTPSCIFLVNSSGKMKSTTSASSMTQCGNCRNLLSQFLLQKFREINAFSTKIRCKLFPVYTYFSIECKFFGSSNCAQDYGR